MNVAGFAVHRRRVCASKNCPDLDKVDYGELSASCPVGHFKAVIEMPIAWRDPVIAVPHKPITREEWPIWAKALAQFAKPEDKGIGDVVARMIGDENSAKFKAWHLATFGKPCGCNGRQRGLNIKYQLP